MRRSGALALLALTSCVEVIDAPIPSAARYESMIFVEIASTIRGEALPTDQEPTLGIGRMAPGDSRYALLYNLALPDLRVRTGTVSLVVSAIDEPIPFSQPIPPPDALLAYTLGANNGRWTRLEGLPPVLEGYKITGWAQDRCRSAGGCYPDSTAEMAGYCETPCGR